MDPDLYDTEIKPLNKIEAKLSQNAQPNIVDAAIKTFSPIYQISPYASHNFCAIAFFRSQKNINKYVKLTLSSRFIAFLLF